MKLSNTPSVKSKSGMTLLELTVVILVLLTLISILFIGARAWKKGSDRAANILNVRNCQQAMRGHQFSRNFVDTDAVSEVEIFGDGTTAKPGYLKRPKTPVIFAAGYTFKAKYGLPGVIWTVAPDIGGDAATGEYFFSTAEIAAGKTEEW